MGPMVVDVLAYLDVARSPVKTQLADALGAEVKEIVGCQAAVIPSKHSVGGVRHSNVCSLSNSKVIQFMRCSLMAKRLLGDVAAWLLVRACGQWTKPKSDSTYCIWHVWFRPKADVESLFNYSYQKLRN